MTWQSFDVPSRLGCRRLNDRAGLKDIAELCRRHTLAHPGRDWNDVRDGMLTIACEWDLANDRLDAQSDACLDCLARFLS